jgi:hypothetical protein
VQLTAADAIANAHAWFEVNSGWAPPDEGTLAEWIDDGVCRCPDECLVEPETWCDHGLASWWLILRALDQAARTPDHAARTPDGPSERSVPADDRTGLA